METRAVRGRASWVKALEPLTVIAPPDRLLRPSPRCGAFGGRRTSLRENTYTYDTCTEDLESCQEALEGGLIRKRALQNGLDRLQ